MQEYVYVRLCIGTVPEKLERIPDQLLEIKFGTINVAPNMTMKMSQVRV